MRPIMSTLVGGLALVAILSATPARAGGINNFLAGIQGLATFPADPVMDTITPPDLYEDLPAYPVTGRFFGFFQGTLLGAYRLGMGVFDVALTPLWILPTMSPEPRWELIEGVEYGE